MGKMSLNNSGRNTAARAATDHNTVLVLRLAEASDNHRSLVGGKAFNLAKLIAAGLPVPRGFCVTTAAFDHFLASSSRRTELSHLLAQCSGDEIGRIAELSRDIRSCLAEVHMPDVVRMRCCPRGGNQVKIRALPCVPARPSRTLPECLLPASLNPF